MNTLIMEEYIKTLENTIRLLMAITKYNEMIGFTDFHIVVYNPSVSENKYVNYGTVEIYKQTHIDNDFIKRQIIINITDTKYEILFQKLKNRSIYRKAICYMKPDTFDPSTVSKITAFLYDYNDNFEPPKDTV